MKMKTDTVRLVGLLFTFCAVVALITFIFPRVPGANFQSMLAEICAGGILLGACFMANDYTTSPINKRGQIVYGIGCGVITVVIRYFGGYPEGVSYAILIMNCCVVLLDRIGRPTKFGAPKKVKEAKKA